MAVVMVLSARVARSASRLEAVAPEHRQRCVRSPAWRGLKENARPWRRDWRATPRRRPCRRRRRASARDGRACATRRNRPACTKTRARERGAPASGRSAGPADRRSSATGKRARPGRGICRRARRRRRRGSLREAGSHDIDAVERGLVGDCSVLRAQVKLASVMVRSKCLAILCCRARRRPSGRSRPGRAAAGACGWHGLGDGGQIALGGGEQVFALAGALAGQIGVAADRSSRSPG